MDNSSEVREFLATRRAKLSPQQAGVPLYGTRRRVPGLRRSEVATLAGVSIEYYSKLERGGLAGVSASILDAIDRAGDPLDRKSVVDAYFATTDRDSVLGSYSIDDAGDTSLGLVGAYRQREGATLRPLREPLAVP